MANVMEAVESVEEGIRRLRDKAEVSREELRHTAVQAKQKVTEALSDARRYTQKHPLQVIGAAFAVGALVGAVISRRRG